MREISFRNPCFMCLPVIGERQQVSLGLGNKGCRQQYVRILGLLLVRERYIVTYLGGSGGGLGGGGDGGRGGSGGLGGGGLQPMRRLIRCMPVCGVRQHVCLVSAPKYDADSRAPIRELTWVAEGVVEGAAVEGWGVEGCRQYVYGQHASKLGNLCARCLPIFGRRRRRVLLMA